MTLEETLADRCIALLGNEFGRHFYSREVNRSTLALDAVGGSVQDFVEHLSATNEVGLHPPTEEETAAFFDTR